MDHDVAYDDGKVTCAWCRRVLDAERVKPICGDCVFDFDQAEMEADRLWSRVRDQLDRSHGIRPSVVLLMAVAWMAVTLMESLP